MQIISRALSLKWADDAAASPHVFDQKSIFGQLIPIKIQKIMVGGGSLYASFMGEVEIICNNRSSFLLLIVLYVPNLSVHLCLECVCVKMV